RIGRSDKAEFNFREAIEVAHQIDVLSKAGIASLTLIEEIDHLEPDVLAHAYQQAEDWLSNCQSEELLRRFKVAGTKMALELLREKAIEEETKNLFNLPRDLTYEVLQFERDLISQALAKVDGRIVYAANLLGISYQTLAHRIRSKHPALLKERTPIRRRPRKS
ncbi:MAG TPA: helix-turn-helix domain-containing protein, partial [Anaerolineales bacterium]|nr:helix-turn-helix domain-containing protein [Anaerolineales bacterium]